MTDIQELVAEHAVATVAAEVARLEHDLAMAVALTPVPYRCRIEVVKVRSGRLERFDLAGEVGHAACAWRR